MAKVLTGISGNLISAASAGFAPTNSADVSAIASAYQVVSATATQLYAGTAYVTSVNGAPLSASRAGNAANASLATSAWYDGTGRLISSLPDSAAVSAIASAYAESAASSKQDTLTFGYDDGKISSIDGSALAGQGGGGMITSIQSSLDPWYQTAISGLNGSALYSRWSISAEYAKAAGTADYANSAGSAGAAPTAWASSFITGVSSPSGTIRVLGGTAIESTNSAVMPSTVIEGFSTSSAGATIGPGVKLNCVLPTANPSTEIIVALSYNPGLVIWSSDNGIEGSQAKGNAPETITVQFPNATAVDIWSDSWIPVNSVTASAATQELGGGVGELAWASALPTYEYDAEDKISAINGSAIAGGAGGVDSATVSAIASAYAESAVSSKADSSALSSYVPYSSLEYNTASAISGINGSALAAGSTYSAGEGIDITDDEISVDYDTNTLDVTGQAVTEKVTQQSASGLFLLPSSVAALLSQQADTQVTVHIPANMLRDVNYDYSDEPSITFRFTLYATDSTSETNVSLFSTALSWENYNWEYGLIDEQDIVFNLPANVANQWSQSLSSAVAFSICGQRYSRPLTDSPVELFGDLSTDPITFTFVDASATKLAVKNPLPSSTSADEGKCLVVDSNGDPEWGTGGKTYTGTDGVVVDNVNDTVGLEAPVDIVAGSGIVIDNPDGNTLRVSTDENYETVLFEGTAATSVTCSEAITNFELLKVYVTPAAVTTDTMIQIVEMIPGKFGSYMMLAGYQSNLFHIYGGRIANSGTTTLKTENGFHMWVPITSGGSVGNESSNSKIVKIVGVHRIANN